MNVERLRELLESVRDRSLTPERALQALRYLPYEGLSYAKLDHHRPLRTGFPEAVFCEGKRPDQVVEIVKRLSAAQPVVLATRADAQVREQVRSALPEAEVFEEARLVRVGRPPDPPPHARPVAVLTGGTTDIPVAEEAALTVESMGLPALRIYDVGVAGLHRLLGELETIRSASAVVAVAGMEGALPGVVAGLIDLPVIAVPSSVGYGTNQNGLTPLFTMLNSCAPGMAAVNVDNGFGAGYMAVLIGLNKDKGEG